MLIISYKGSAIDLMHVLFGTVLALDDAALILLGAAASLTLLTLAVLMRVLVAECVDPTFLSVARGPGGIVHLAFMVLVVLNLVAGFQALGTLLAVGIMMLPAAASRFWARRLGGMLVVAVAVAVVSCLAGLLISYHASLASGPTITLSAGILYLISVAFGPHNGLVWRAMPTRHRTVS